MEQKPEVGSTKTGIRLADLMRMMQLREIERQLQPTIFAEPEQDETEEEEEMKEAMEETDEEEMKEEVVEIVKNEKEPIKKEKGMEENRKGVAEEEVKEGSVRNVKNEKETIEKEEEVMEGLREEEVRAETVRRMGGSGKEGQIPIKREEKMEKNIDELEEGEMREEWMPIEEETINAEARSTDSEIPEILGDVNIPGTGAVPTTRALARRRQRQNRKKRIADLKQVNRSNELEEEMREGKDKVMMEEMGIQYQEDMSKSEEMLRAGRSSDEPENLVGKGESMPATEPIPNSRQRRIRKRTFERRQNRAMKKTEWKEKNRHIHVRNLNKDRARKALEGCVTTVAHFNHRAYGSAGSSATQTRRGISSLDSLLEMGYQYIPADDKAFAVIDGDDRLILVRVKRPSGNTSLAENLDDYMKMIQPLARRAYLNRGPFSQTRIGVHHDTKNKTPHMFPVRSRILAKRLKTLLESPAALGLTKHIWSKFLDQKTEEIREKVPHDDAAYWLESTWTSCTLNVGPRTVIQPYIADEHLACGICALYVTGQFDSTKGGHVVFDDIQLIMEACPGDLFLYPSGLLTRSSTPVGPEEVRRSIMFWTCADTVRHFDMSHTNTENESETKYTDAYKHAEAMFQAALKRFHTLDELKAW
ncbi:hypothetical protein FRC17_005180 [Serendipita sp. 399]|nr:hypothetical protein FRC17_005180 [Serendipita sp. 399]